MKTLKQLQSEQKYATDKGLPSHTFRDRSYLDRYDEILPSLRSTPGNVLEIGVLFGGSLRLWRDYFSGSTKIVGIDIDPARKESEAPQEGIHVEIGSQADAGFLKDVCAKYGPFKFILDDGSHFLTHMLKSFSELWPSLAPGGIYAMEDLRLSYHNVDENWPGMTHNPPEDIGPNNRAVFNEWSLNLIKQMDYHEGDIRRIDFHPMICAITRA